MAYESIIGETQLLYQINYTGTPTLVEKLLSPSDISELVNWAINYRSENKKLTDVVVLDGFIQGDSPFIIRHKIGGVGEIFAADEKAYFPYVDWHKKVYISGSGSGSALVKFVIGFTKRPA